MRSFEGYAWLLLGRALPGATNFVNAFVLSGVFGAATYGTYSARLSLALSLSTLFFGWISQSVLRFAYGRASLPQTGGTFLMAYSLAVTVCLVALFGAAPWWGWRSSLAALGVIGFGAHLILLARYQTQFNHSRYTAAEAVRSAAMVSFPLLGGLTFPRPEAGVICGLYASFAVWPVWELGVASLHWFTGSMAPPVKDHPDGYEGLTIPGIFSYGFAVSLWLAVSLGVPFLERELMARMYGKEVMGEYAFAYDIVFRGFTFVLLPFVMIAQPRIFRAFTSGEHHIAAREVRRAVAQQLAIGFVFAIALFLIVRAVAGRVALAPQVSDPYYFITLASAAVVWQVALLAHKALEYRRRTGLMLVTLLAVVVSMNVFGNMLLRSSVGVESFPAMTLVAGLLYLLVVRMLSSIPGAASRG